MDHDDAARIRGVIGKLSRRLNASATGQGLTPSQASALGLITGKGRLGLAELAEIEGLNPSMVSRIVGRLDELGLVERVQNPQDLRAATVQITETGRLTNERIRETRGAVVSECLARLPEADRTSIANALPALEALAEELRSPAPPPRETS
jgi:DNA-binding MarR family transcriptional regulator